MPNPTSRVMKNAWSPLDRDNRVGVAVGVGDGNKVAVEWTWEVSRRADGARSTTFDAIIVDLVDGKIKSWREYFDLSTSVEGS